MVWIPSQIQIWRDFVPSVLLDRAGGEKRIFSSLLQYLPPRCLSSTVNCIKNQYYISYAIVISSLSEPREREREKRAEYLLGKKGNEIQLGEKEIKDIPRTIILALFTQDCTLMVEMRGVSWLKEICDDKMTCFPSPVWSVCKKKAVNILTLIDEYLILHFNSSSTIAL